jgi:hypothetical protein
MNCYWLICDILKYNIGVHVGDLQKTTTPLLKTWWVEKDCELGHYTGTQRTWRE